MSATAPNPFNVAVHPALPGPYAARPAGGSVEPTQAVLNLVRTQVQSLLRASPAYYAIAPEERSEMERNLTKIAAYSAALLHDGFVQAEKLGQAPLLREQRVIEPALARAAAEEDQPAPDQFAPRAVGQVGRLTEETLNAIAFPTFVSDLIKGTFNAIVDASIQQMEAYGRLLANVAKTVDQFMADNITDNQARDWLVERYPGHFAIDTTGGSPRVTPREGHDQLPKPDFRTDLGLSENVELDEDTAEEVLRPAARRKLAQNRHELLATMVLMGINRIVVTSGRVRARMDFHIDASDTGRAESASQFDYHHDTFAVAGWLGWGVASRTSIAYVSSAKRVSTDEINVAADLTGELDLKFRSETFPLERFADTGAITRIQAATANPSANPPAGPRPVAPPER